MGDVVCVCQHNHIALSLVLALYFGIQMSGDVFGGAQRRSPCAQVFADIGQVTGVV